MVQHVLKGVGAMPCVQTICAWLGWPCFRKSLGNSCSQHLPKQQEMFSRSVTCINWESHGRQAYKL